MTATKTRKPRRSAEERQAANAARWKMLADLAETMALAMELDPLTREQVEAVAAASGYTERNASLIVGQCSAATVARSFKAWKEQGRQVRKGEKAIYILASTARRTVGQDDEMVTEAPEPEPQANSGEDAEKKASRPRFVAVPVFDVSQTDPAQADDEAPED